MTKSHAVEISILEQNYTLTCPIGKEATLREAASVLDAKLKDIKASGRVIGIERMAVMAALNMSGELLEYKAQINTLETAMSQLDDRIAKALDQ